MGRVYLEAACDRKQFIFAKEIMQGSFLWIAGEFVL